MPSMLDKIPLELKSVGYTRQKSPILIWAGFHKIPGSTPAPGVTAHAPAGRMEMNAAEGR
jgi:hypothetical protein